MDFYCRICGSRKIADTYIVKEMMFGLKDEYCYERCASCNVIQLSTPVTDLSKLYPSHYYSFNNIINDSVKEKLFKYVYLKVVAKELGYKNLVGYIFSKIKSSSYQSAPEARALKGIVKKDDKILDVGCGSGKLIEALHVLGYNNVSGIDPFISKDVFKPVTILKKHLNELSDDHKYDVIMMHHSLEHMDDPLSIFKKIKSMLNEGGRVIIRIPVSDSYAFEKYKSNWYQLDAPRHIFLHTNRSIDFLAKEAGLKVIDCKDDSTIYQFVISEQYGKGMPISDSRSYATSFSKELNPFRKTIFSNEDIRKFKSLTHDVNSKNKGDQRVFILSSL